MNVHFFKVKQITVFCLIIVETILQSLPLCYLTEKSRKKVKKSWKKSWKNQKKLKKFRRKKRKNYENKMQNQFIFDKFSSSGVHTWKKNAEN